MTQFFAKVQKPYFWAILGLFGPLFHIFEKMRIFPKKYIQNIRKTNEPIPIKVRYERTNYLTNGRTDIGEFIGSFPVNRGSNYWHFTHFRVLFWPKLILWRHRRARVFKIVKFGLNNRILPVIISLNANFHIFIHIPRGIIDILPILGYFWA